MEKEGKIIQKNIPDSEIMWLGMALAPAIEKFFSDTTNMEAYEEWKKEHGHDN